MHRRYIQSASFTCLLQLVYVASTLITSNCFQSLGVRHVKSVRQSQTFNLSGGSNDESGFWNDRWEAADKMEIRLDATLVSIHTLARFLAYDVSLPIKEQPGFEIEDIVMLLDTFTSAAVLALLWTVGGLVIGLFEEIETNRQKVGMILATAVLAAPPWLLLEIVLGWPASDGSGLERVVLGTLGLFATMVLARFVSSAFYDR